MKLKNYTKFDNKSIKEIIKFVRPSGLSNFEIGVKNSKNGFCGRCYYNGCSYHGNFSPYVVIRIGDKIKFPIDNGQDVDVKGKGYLSGYKLFTTEEVLVYLMAHELRHLWQAKHRRGYRYYNCRGQFSERDADCYAIHKLREWRRN